MLPDVDSCLVDLDQGVNAKPGYSDLAAREGGLDLTALWLNTIGLLLGMAGVVIIFIWGSPQPDLDEDVKVALDTGTVLTDGRKVSDMEEAARRLKRQHEIMSRVGLGLIGVGFLAQLVALWLPILRP